MTKRKAVCKNVFETHFENKRNAITSGLTPNKKAILTHTQTEYINQQKVGVAFYVSHSSVRA